LLKLRVLTGPRAGRLITITDQEPVTIGRNSGRVRLHDSRVSKEHAQITFVESGWVLRDLGSSNGCIVNRTVLRGLAELETGDLLQFGRVLVKVQQADAIGMDSAGGLPGALAALSGIGPATAPPTPARSGLGLPAADASIDDDDEELDLDALFAAQDGKGLEDDEDDEPFDLPQPKPQKVVAREELLDEPAPPPRVKRPESPLAAAPSVTPDALADSQASSVFDQAFAGNDETGQDASAATATGKADNHPQGLDAATASGGDADLIQIEDDTPDAGRPPGSTVVLPETAQYPAVDESLEVDADERDDAASSQLANASAWDELFDPARPDAAAEEELELLAKLAGKSVSAAGDIASSEAEADDEAHLTSATDDLIGAEVAADPEVLVESSVDAEVDPIADPVLDDPADAAAADADIAAEIDRADEPPHDFDADDLTPAIAQSASNDTPSNDTAADDGEAWAGQAAVAVQVDEDEDDLDINAATADLDDFDIDAAFADLEAGLDDETGPDASAASAGDRPDTVDAASAPADGTPANAPPGLIGSQLDVAFIQEALAKLPEVDRDRHPLGLQRTETPKAAPPQSPAAEPAQSPSDAVGSAQAVSEELTQDAATDTDALHTSATEVAVAATPAAPATPLAFPPQTPPGVNPVSLVEPEEPRSSRIVSHRSDSSVRRFLPAAIILLFVGGLSGFFIANPSAITGRPKPPRTTTPTNPEPANPAPVETQDPATNPAPTQPVERETFEINPNGQRQPQPPTAGTDPSRPGTAAQPDPFAQGPAVIGPDALAGIGSRNIPAPPETIPPQTDQPNNTPPVNTNVPPITSPIPGTTPDPAVTGNNNPDAPPIAADGDRLVFLVDASGSLVDTLPQMLGWLGEAMDSLEPNEQFTIIFFKQGKTIEVPPGGLQPMTRNHLRELEREWLAPDRVPVLPAGRSDPTAALTLALSYQPSDIYLLSDESFGKSSGDMTRDQAIANITDTIGDAKVRIHGVQFFYQDQDQAGTLQLLAAEYEGTYEFVAEALLPDQDPIDLLEQLENRNR